ncbi:MAG TPA: gliding motility-associated C-terminal domain-containing protein, partial [Ferruginibacter sp.]|nr:gliding motility-associated C-terminal domain-containing protein [Ferruginibacter sp.]
EPVAFKDTSIGNIVAWNWNFGNGQTSLSPNPPNQVYSFSSSNFDVPVTLTVTNNLGCQSTIIHYITILSNCYIAVPSAFTPNGDGLNDYLYPLNAYKTSNLQFSIYNRAGQRLFNSNNWQDKWDGKFKGKPCDMGTYVWILSYYNLETGKYVEQKGSTVLIR